MSAGLAFCGATSAQEAKPASKVAALLPPARAVSGLQLKITDAGFSAPKDVGINSQDSALSGFYFSCQVTGAAKNTKPIAGAYSPVEFHGLFAPDGAPVSHRGGYGSEGNWTWFFTEVQPQWDHVRAEFEVRNPLASDEQTGSITTRKEFDRIDLPAPGQTKKPDEPVEFTTPKGTRLQLVEITRSAEDDSLKARWNITSAKNSGLEVQLLNGGAYYTSGTETKRSIGSSFGFEERNGDYIVRTTVRAEQASLGYIFDIVETSRAWREAGAIELVSLDIPVNAIWKRAPLALRAPALPAAEAHNDGFSVKWENLVASKYNGLYTQVWLRDLAPSPDGERWTLKTVSTGEQAARQSWDVEESSRKVFHTNNEPSDDAESNTLLRLAQPVKAPERGDVTLGVQRARTLLSTHVLRDVPLPVRDGMLEFERGQFFDGSWHLRRVLLMEDKDLRARLQRKEPAMILTFDVDPATYQTQDAITQWGTRNFYDEKGALSFSDYIRLIKGDLMETGHEKDRVMMILPLPAQGTKSFGGNFQVFQRAWSGPEKTLVLPDVPLSANFKRDDMNME